jgi:probable phosphoglycerate mutase
MTRFLIVRHGNTFSPGETVLRTGARTDLPLSPSGLAQAHALGPALRTHLANHPVRFVIAGPLRRTQETASALTGQLPGPALAMTCEALREIDHGPDEGQPETAVLARLGEAALEAWEQHASMPSEWSPRPDVLIAQWRALLSGLARPEPSAVVLVTSNGLARFALRALAFAPDTPAPPGKLRTGAFGVIDTDDGETARLIAWDQRP